MEERHGENDGKEKEMQTKQQCFVNKNERLSVCTANHPCSHKAFISNTLKKG